MKKIIVLLFLICAIPLSACSKAPEQIPAPTVQRLTSPLELSEDEAATLIQCCGENSVLLAVGHRNTAQTGPLYNSSKADSRYYKGGRSGPDCDARQPTGHCFPRSTV